MAKIRLTGATFDASEKTVVHTNFSDVTLAGIQLIVNVTDQIIIYNFADTAKGGTLATDTLTLEYDTTSMSDADELMILVEDGVASVAINDGGNTITVDGTVAVTNAGLTELAAAIDTEVQVDVVGALPAGNNNIGDVDVASIAAGDNNIGNVDIVTLPGDVEADIDQIRDQIDLITPDIEEIRVDADAIRVATQATQTAAELIDDTVATLGTTTYTETTTKGLTIGAVRRDADTTLVGTTNEIGPLQMDANGRLKVEAFSGEALPVTFTGSTDAATQTTLAAATTALQIMDDWDNGASDGASVSGDVAHDTADAGEPVKIGMKAVALKVNPTEVAANDRTNWYADVSGVPFVLGGHPNILSQSLQITDADGAQTDTAIVTAGANVAIVVTKISVMADNANTTDVSVRIGFGTANTPAADAAQVILFHPGIAAGSGVVEGSGSGILGIGASNEDLRVTCEDPVTGSINIIVTYFTTDI